MENLNEIKQPDDTCGQIDLLVSPPFYEDDYVKIYNMDCLTGMIALRPFDVIVTDPPYGIGADAKAAATGGKMGLCAMKTVYEKTNWDNERPQRTYFELMKYVSRHQIIFGGNYFADYLEATMGWLIWVKNANGNFSDGELAWTSWNKAIKKYEYTWNGMIQGNMKEKEERVHPTQKPLPLMINILEDHTTPTDLICDPFMGSGTTLVAAKALGRKAVGFEINPKYCTIAAERLKAVQTRLIFGGSG